MEKAVSLRALKHRRAIFGDLSPEKTWLWQIQNCFTPNINTPSL